MDADDVRSRLSRVDDPDLDADIVSLGLINAVDVAPDTIKLSLALGAPYAPTETAIADDVREVLADTDRNVELTAAMPSALRTEDEVLPNIQNIIAVASGKGGVGKSTVSVNLAAGLAERGARVGLFDADIYGPNVPRMVDSDAPETTEEQTLHPPEQYGMKLMSMDFLVGDVVDLPPGTGDTQLTVLQTLPLTGAVIVTTPQQVAIDDAVKGLRMFGEHETPVLGIAENMSSFRCPDCGGEHDIFGSGGGEAFADDENLPFLGAIPLDPAIRAGGDGGTPIVREETAAADAFRTLTENVADTVGVVRRQQVRSHAQSAPEQ